MEQQLSVVYATSTMIHYTRNLCDEFIANKHVKQFKLIITESLGSKYTSMGVDGSTSGIDYLIDAREDPQSAKEAILNSDLVIGQYCVTEWLRERIKTNKTTFIISERVFKQYDSPIINRIKNAARWLKYKKILLSNSFFRENVYYLLIGKYAFSDYIKLGVKADHILCFGYFPKVAVNTDKKVRANDNIHLLWVGRLVTWKHPEYAIETCFYLKEKGYPVDLLMIGGGPLEDEMKRQSMDKEYIKVLGGVPTDFVRQSMRDSDIYLFTSNQGEGWGVVLNEAMSEEMVVIGSDSAGSTGLLIQDGINGFIYKNDNLSQLKEKTEYAVVNKKMFDKIGREAQKTIRDTWNARVAVDNVISQYYTIQSGEKPKKLKGPASSI